MTPDSSRQETAQEHLRKILALLGPNLFLHVDDSFLAAAFGRDDMSRKAEEFAKRHECVFFFEGYDRGGRFGRAYFAEEKSQ